MSRHTQHIEPRCPKCKRNRRAGLGYDLVELRRTEKGVTIRCKTCHYEWRSTGTMALNGALHKQKEVSK